MKRTAKARWSGDLTTGHGDLTTQSHVLNKAQYSFSTRFASGIGTNPEELIAAAHAGCFTMSLVYALGQLGFKPGELETVAHVTVDPVKGSIAGIELVLTALSIEGLSEDEFQQHAETAKEHCPVSRALAGVPITFQAHYGDLQLTA